ncbi:hypothetical protein ASF83_00365 [Plantibacter sp. Leaf171]|uniref:hypothetical protein n=1 Tax=unclassified Plantibacter TaxID=2624265 RepID=UPI0006F3C2E8|nr:MULTISPECIES: hypothetical protein [unclassified Plantibacter]KQM17622.1 hypothetical protein ASE44_00380 [Plantibacter sp. Leaf1]KQR60403.1 hypothetical protein ASF83_00365 [Plantibacter sp. Leaf171]
MRADTTVTDRRGRAGHARRPIGTHRRLVASVVALAALLLAAQPAPAQTEAAWTVTRFGSASFSAFTVPSPAITSCTFNPNTIGLLSSYTVVYTIPAGYTINYAYSPNASFTSPTVITPTSTSGTTTVTSTFSLGLLGGLLGSNVYIGARLTLPSTTWSSPYRLVNGTSNALGTNGGCAIVP